MGDNVINEWSKRKLMLIKNLVLAVLSVFAFFLTMRYNLHMFQLNGYKNNEQSVWLKKNRRRQWVLYAGVGLGILQFGISVVMSQMTGQGIGKTGADGISRTWLAAELNNNGVMWIVTGILDCLWLLLIIVVYNLMRKQPAKKKLVYTARVKRLIATDVVLSLLIAVAGGGILAAVQRDVRLQERDLGGLFLIMVSWQFAALIVANIVNKPIENGVKNYYINDAKKKLSEVSHLTVIGVTGSYGKTSVKFYLQTLLQQKYNVLVTPESYNTPMGVVKTIRESLKSTHEIFVCEMGARYVGDIKEICDIVHPKHGVITSIGPQHLETFGGMEQVKNTKFELADALPSGGFLFLNGDNEYIREKETAGGYHSRKEDPLKVVFYSASETSDMAEITEMAGDPELNRNESKDEKRNRKEADPHSLGKTGQRNREYNGYYAKEIFVSQLGTNFTVVSPKGEEESYQMRLVGAHNVINVVGAIAVANTLGIALKDLKVPVRKLQPVKHRLELIERGEVTIIDDAYNSNPVGSRAAVETLAMFDGVKILVTPGMVELGKDQDDYNYKFGTYAADCCDYILLVGKRNTEPILKGALSKGFAEEKCRVFEKLQDALSFAYSIKDAGHKYILLENDLPDNYL